MLAIESIDVDSQSTHVLDGQKQGTGRSGSAAEGAKEYGYIVDFLLHARKYHNP